MARKTVEVALRDAARQLADISDSPWIDAERLLLKIFGESETSWLMTDGDQEISDRESKLIQELIERRSTGEPLAYILGEWGFYGRTFEVTPEVLVPRPSTEKLIDVTLQDFLVPILHNMGTEDNQVVIADIGTGSGCIAVTLACELTNFQFPISSFQILATDISPTALEVARRNAERHQVSNKIEWLEGDMLEPLADRKVDLIVSNPPYLPAEALAKAGCARDTRGLDFEPKAALDGGEDGLHFVEQFKESQVPAIVESVGGKVLLF